MGIDRRKAFGLARGRIGGTDPGRRRPRHDVQVQTLFRKSPVNRTFHPSFEVRKRMMQCLIN